MSVDKYRYFAWKVLTAIKTKKVTKSKNDYENYKQSIKYSFNTLQTLHIDFSTSVYFLLPF